MPLPSARKTRPKAAVDLPLPLPVWTISSPFSIVFVAMILSRASFLRRIFSACLALISASGGLPSSWRDPFADPGCRCVAPRQRQRAMVRTHGLTHIALAVRDPERSFRFYQDVLGVVAGLSPGRFHPGSDARQPRRARLRGRPAHAGKAGGIAHFGFRLVRPGRHRAPPPRRSSWPAAITSHGEFVAGEPYVFFTDPDGYEVEIWYELPHRSTRRADRLRTRWASSGRLASCAKLYHRRCSGAAARDRGRPPRGSGAAISSSAAGLFSAMNAAHRGVAEIGVVERVEVMMLHRVRGGGEGEQVVDRRRDLEGALVAVAHHARDPLRIGGAAAHDARDLLRRARGSSGARGANGRCGRSPARRRAASRTAAASPPSNW